MQIELSDGTAVTFKDFYSHKADKVLWETMNKDVKLIRDEFGEVKSTEIPPGNVQAAYEAAMSYLIASPECTQDWLDNMRREDFTLLYDAMLRISKESSEKKERGKKSK